MSREQTRQMWGTRFVSTGQPQVEEQSEDPRREFLSFPFSSDLKLIMISSATVRWVRGELIRQGTYGSIYLALNGTTGEIIAVKQVEFSRKTGDEPPNAREAVQADAIKSEIELVKDLDHPNVVQYLGFEETPSCLSL